MVAPKNNSPEDRPLTPEEKMKAAQSVFSAQTRACADDVDEFSQCSCQLCQIFADEASIACASAAAAYEAACGRPEFLRELIAEAKRLAIKYNDARK